MSRVDTCTCPKVQTENVIFSLTDFTFGSVGANLDSGLKVNDVIPWMQGVYGEMHSGYILYFPAH